jgi:hypothetical protein
MSAWTYGWILWILWFCTQEGVALVNPEPDDTLSEHVWRWLRVGDKRSTPITVAGRVVLGLGIVWLLGHLTMGWWS